MEKFEERPGTEQRKLLVVVRNIPEGIVSLKAVPGATSELKSLTNTRSKVMNSNRGSTTY